MYTDQSDEFVDKLTNLIPMGRMAKKDEYKGSIAFLCSDSSSYMTGHNLIVDGGMTVQIQENLVMDVKDYIVANPDLKTHFDSERGSSRF